MNILVTGGSQGLGAAIVKKLAEKKENTIYFTYATSEESSKKITSALTNTHSFRCDFIDSSTVNDLVEKIPGWEIDVLINNAFILAEKEHFHKADPAKYLESFQKNLLPTIQLTKAALNVFRKKKSGKIINVLSSFIINKPVIGMSDYIASKNYLLSLSKSWATENIRFNITSNCVSPSFLKTNYSKDVDERIIEQMIESHPLKKLLTVEEVAEAVSFLTYCTSHINGINLVMNAGSDLV